jgi:hypothetical protein
VKVRLTDPPAGGFQATMSVRLTKPVRQTVEVPVRWTARP